MPSSQQAIFCHFQVVTADGDLLEAGPSSSPGTCPAIRFSVAASSSIAPATWAVSSVASLEPLLAVVLSDQLWNCDTIIADISSNSWECSEAAAEEKGSTCMSRWQGQLLCRQKQRSTSSQPAHGQSLLPPDQFMNGYCELWWINGERNPCVHTFSW